ncbi:MAG: PRC-barrel domain-containing protein [Gemmatimonadaceae bacterium]|nr:PRC-barrel domain-containing protein [Gemmatimonadaceae bacterium]NUP54778.1 PRC-barrel domain-containing protein [Gemmatimonadaceae bacterium]NUS34012.1 PRC-barrel domain-containing protein [Gemmatimonadaceae bacterium]NUS48534.1 PRC-barrel domain-containing protein [Gemmatimonadaceae bacterium]
MARMDRDQAGIGPHAAAAVDLVPLRKLEGVRVVEGDADVRGWDVCTINGAKVGTVDDLLVDRARGEVVMLDVGLVGSSRHTLAPIRSAQIDRARRIVLIDSADLNGPADVASLSRPAEPTAAMDGLRAADLAPPPEVRTAEGAEETVIERRPVVYEEVVVRRRVVDPATPDADRPIDPPR